MRKLRLLWRRLFGAGRCACSCDCPTLMTTGAAVCSFCCQGDHDSDLPHHLATSA